MALQGAEEARLEYERLTNLRDNGTYVPPAKLRALLAQFSVTQGSLEMQKMQWESLKKQINGLVNKTNKSNIKAIAVDLFKLNLLRGQGLFVRSLMKAQSQALGFTPVYAALVAVLNSKIPQLGELLISRLVLQFKKAFKRNNKVLCLSSTTFLAHLCNQEVCHEIIILEIAHLLLINPTDDSVDICCGILKHCGLFLSEVSSNAVGQVFEKLRTLLQEGMLEKRTQYIIEILFQVRRDAYSDYPVIPDGLDLVDVEDQNIHEVRLDDKLKAQDNLNVFAEDPQYDGNEQKYDSLRHDILGSDEESGESDKEYAEDDEGVEEVEQESEEAVVEAPQPSLLIKDMTQKNLTNFRKTIYLILKGSMSADEAVHKIIKLGTKPDEQSRVVEMIVQACSQERTYSKFYGSTGEKLCGQSKSWSLTFKDVFRQGYETIHRLEPNELRNVSKFWGHMLSSDGLGWEALECIKLTETETSSAGRIFIKFIFQELVEELGIPHLKERLDEEYIQPSLVGIFPSDDPQLLQFSINFFTAIGLGILTDEMRDNLDALKRQRLENRGRSRSRSPSGNHTASESLSRSRSGSYSSGSYSRSRSRSYSRSRTPSRSPSRSAIRESIEGPPVRQVNPRSRMPQRSRSRSPAPVDYRDSLRYRGTLRDQSEEFQKSGFQNGNSGRYRRS